MIQVLTLLQKKTKEMWILPKNNSNDDQFIEHRFEGIDIYDVTGQRDTKTNCNAKDKADWKPFLGGMSCMTHSFIIFIIYFLQIVIKTLNETFCLDRINF